LLICINYKKDGTSYNCIKANCNSFRKEIIRIEIDFIVKKTKKKWRFDLWYLK
jgi:hypothetical protein